MSISPARPDAVLTVLQLTRHIKRSLEEHYPAVWVRGEVSGCKRAPSGHFYFALKEGKDALLDCALWRTHAQRVSFEPQDGLEVEAFGSIQLYEPRGRYQLSVKELRPAGQGALWLKYEKLKKKLFAEGLFDDARKQPLPRYPTRIGVVTSPVGAAVRDIVTVLRTRWPSLTVVLAPVRVQGPEAVREIVAAIERFNRYGGVDLLIAGRGGGSIEDLWAFNEEAVVRAIAASRIPVISAVGHEVDETLSDLVADRRAATPSHAAEIAVRLREDEIHRIAQARARMIRAIRDRIREHRRDFEALVKRYGFRRQRDALGPIQQRIDGLAERLRTALSARMRSASEQVRAIQQRYGLREWPREIGIERERTAERFTQLTLATRRGLSDRRRRVTAVADRLRALSPSLVLERGFCIVRRPDGSLVRAATEVSVDDRVAIEFARGNADARIETVRPGGTE